MPPYFFLAGVLVALCRRVLICCTKRGTANPVTSVSSATRFRLLRARRKSMASLSAMQGASFAFYHRILA